MVSPKKLIKNKKVVNRSLEEILAAFWNADVVVSDVTYEPATSRGNNFICDAWIIRFKHKKKRRLQFGTTDKVENAMPSRRYSLTRKDRICDSVFLKTRRDSIEHNILMNTDTAFRNEILAYEKIMTALNVYSNGPLRVPTYVHGDPISIVLEDMGNLSFKSMNRNYVTSWNQVWSPIQEMARLHAASIVMKKLNNQYFREMIREIEPIPVDETGKLKEMQKSTIATTIKLLKLNRVPNFREQIQILKEIEKNVWQMQREIISEEAPVMVVNHGNFWINNLVYRKDMIVLFDWQHIVYSSPATDLCFFLYVNFATAFLTNQRKALLDYYLMHLHQSIYDVCTDKKVKISDIDDLLKPLTYEWIDSELKRYTLYGYMMAQWMNPIFYWSEAVFDMMVKAGGMESMSIEERLKTMTSEQKDRVIQLTKLFINEYQIARNT